MTKLEEFYASIMVVDTETTGVDSDAQIIEFSASFPEEYNTSYEDMVNYTERFKPTIEIPAESSAINFITDEDLVDCDSYSNYYSVIKDLFAEKQYFVGHNVQFDRKMLHDNHLMYDNSAPDYFIHDDQWICTLRLAKKLFAENPEFQNLKLSYLWFKFKLHQTCEHKIVPHSAKDDVYMTFKVLVHLVNIAIERDLIDTNKDIGNQISEICNTPSIFTVMPMGKHKGWAMEDVPMNYLEWLVNSSDLLNEDMPNFDYDLSATVVEEISKRLLVKDKDYDNLMSGEDLH